MTTKIQDPHHILPIFVNQVVGSGTCNGVVNITMGVFGFTPQDDRIDPDLTISCRLRMDVLCAKQLRDELDSLLSTVNDPHSDIKSNGHLAAATSESVN